MSSPPMEGHEVLRLTSDVTAISDTVLVTEAPSQPNQVLLLLQLLYLGFTSVAGTVGNIMLLAVAVSRKEVRSPGNMFLVNLGVVDLITNVMTIPVMMVSLTNDAWVFSPGMCHAAAYITTVCLGQSVQSLAHIAGARFLLITKPRHVYQRFCSWKAVMVNITFIWCFTTLIVIIPEFGFFGDISYNSAFGLCTVDPVHENSWIYTTILVAHSILSTLILIPCFYFLTCYRIMASRKKIHQRNAFQRNMSRVEENLNFWKREIGLSRVLIVTLLAYLICWVPFMVIHFLSFGDNISTTAKRISGLMLVTNSCVNPYIYALCNRKFRRAYKDLFSGLWYRVKPQSSSESNTQQGNASNDNKVGILILEKHTSSKNASYDNNAFRVTTSDA